MPLTGPLRRPPLSLSVRSRTVRSALHSRDRFLWGRGPRRDRVLLRDCCCSRDESGSRGARPGTGGPPGGESLAASGHSTWCVCPVGHAAFVLPSLGHPVNYPGLQRGGPSHPDTSQRHVMKVSSWRRGPINVEKIKVGSRGRGGTKKYTLPVIAHD